MSIRNTYRLSSLSVAAVPRSSRRSGSVGGLGRTSSDSSSALSALSGFLTREEFERFFELQTIEVDGKEQTVIHALYEGLYSDGWISARGVGSSAGGSGGGGTAVNLLTSWSDYTAAMATTHALSAGLGYDLYTRVGALEGKNYLDALTLAQSGSGNAVTALSLSSDKKTLTVTKGSTFLTSSEASSIYQPKGNYLTEHQSLADYLTKAEATNTYQPKGSYITAITKSMVEGVLTGNITTHTHSQYLTQHQDISHLLSKTDAASLYVKKAGDTMTGPLQLNSTLKIGATGIVVSYDALNNAICFDGNIYANGWISARGVGSSAGGSGGGGTATNLLTSWGAYTTDMANNYALSAGLGYGLRSDLTALTGRVSTLEGKNYLDALTLAQSGSGNAVTALSLSSDKKTLTVTKGSTFLTDTNLDHINQLDVRSTAATNTYGKKLTMLFMNNSTDSLNDGGRYHNVLHFGRWADSSGGKSEQIALTDNGNMWLRVGTVGSAWEAWHKVLTDANYSGTLDSRYVTLSTAQTITGAKIFSKTGVAANCALAVGGTATNIANTVMTGYTSMIQLIAGAGGATNGSCIGFHNPNTSSAILGYKNTDSNSGYFQFDSDDTNWHVIAKAFRITNGTSSQVLMADGSIQNHYKASVVTTATSDDGMITPLAMNRWTTKTFVTALGTSGNYLTWTKNGVTNNITVPFATAASKLNSRGNLTALTEKNMGEVGVNMYQVYYNGYPTPYGNLLHVRGVGAGELLMGWAGTDGSYASLYYRNHRDNESTANWSPWVTILDSSNFNSVIGSNLTAYVKKSGDTMTGALTAPRVNVGNMYWEAGNGIMPAIAGNNLYTCGKSDGRWANVYATTINVTSTALVSNLNADLLDGVHETSFFRTNRGDITTAYINLTTYTSGASGYANFPSGTYTIVRNGYKELFVNLAANAGSTSALQFRTSYQDDAVLRYRKTIDANRVSGPWRTILTDLNIGNYNAGSATRLQTNSSFTAWGQTYFANGVPNSISGNMTGVGSIGFSGGGELMFNENSRYLFGTTGQVSAAGVSVGSLLVSSAWADHTKVPTNGIYCKGSLRIGEITLSYDSSAGALKIDGAAYTTGWFSAKGVGSSAGGTGGAVNLLTAWSSYTSSMANTYALSAGLGYDLHTRLQNVYTKGTCDGRYGSTLTISGSTLTLKSPDGTSLKSVTLPTSSGTGNISITNSGSGNAVTAITASGTTLTVTKGSTFSLSNHTHTAYATTMDLTANVLRIRNGNTQLASVTLPYASSAGLEQVSTLAINLYAECGSDLALSGSTLQLKNADGTVVSSVTLPSGSSTTSVKSLYADSKLCATALSTGGIAVYGSITNGGTSTTSNIGNSITSFNAGYFQSVYVKGTAVTSDARLKTIIGEVSLTVEQIAHAPAVNFIWKENGLRSAGSIAQYWRTYLPDTVDVDDMGDKLYLDYSRAALLSAIVTARRVLTVESRMLTAEERIESLTAEVTELKEKLNQYENNNITPNDNEKES